MLRIWQKAAVTLAIVAMVLKGLLPTGWMPNPQGFGETALILCDMDGPMSAADMAKMMPGMSHMDMSHMDMSGMDMSGMDMSGDGKQTPVTGHGHEECPFAAATHAGSAHTVVAFALPELAVEHAHRPVPERSAVRFARYQPQSPRAPPAFSV